MYQGSLHPGHMVAQAAAKTVQVQVRSSGVSGVGSKSSIPSMAGFFSAINSSFSMWFQQNSDWYLVNE